MQLLLFVTMILASLVADAVVFVVILFCNDSGILVWNVYCFLNVLAFSIAHPIVFVVIRGVVIMSLACLIAYIILFTDYVYFANESGIVECRRRSY